jgi:hypothetical protein
MRDARQRYVIEVREQGRRIALQPSEDPFIHTTITPRGWRVAWEILRRRYEVSVHVTGDRERVTDVMKLNHQKPIWPDDVKHQASTRS